MFHNKQKQFYNLPLETNKAMKILEIEKKVQIGSTTQVITVAAVFGMWEHVV